MKNNKLIAEFMGMTPCLTDEGDFLIKGNPIDAKYLPYATSWDWLMPVVKRIVSDVEFIVGYEDEEYREHLMDVVPFANIEDVYEAVVEFINNQNN